jgi:hypothetical protein
MLKFEVKRAIQQEANVGLQILQICNTYKMSSKKSENKKKGSEEPLKYFEDLISYC